MIKWNDGLIVGVKEIDDDHKKLLEIINKLSDSIDNDVSVMEYENIFIELENYVVGHFKREEAYMKKCAYSEFESHQKQHDSFANQIPVLKEKFFSSKDYLDAKDITAFLTDWLINHILYEDMKFVDTFEECGLTNEKKNDAPWLINLIKKSINSVKFTKKIVISTLFPLTGMLILGSIMIYKDYVKYIETDNISQITYTIENVNELTHALQLERGLSSAYLSSNNDNFTNMLKNQRILVDKAKDTLFSKINSIDSKKISLIDLNLQTLKNDMTSLKTMREVLDNKHISQMESIHYFNHMIENILNIPSKIMLINNNNNISYSVSILSKMLKLKETLGQQRALGAAIMGQQNMSPSEYNEYVKLLAIEEVIHTNLEQTSNQNHKDIVNHIFSTPIAKRISAYKMNILNSNYQDIDSKIWFELTTQHIDEIKIFLDTYIKDLNKEVNNNVNNVFTSLTLLIISIAIFLLFTRIIIYVFENSTKKQINYLAHAMKHLAHGGRNLRVKTLNNEDEISQIYDAYEITRLKLLKGDIFTQLYQNQEKIKFNYQQRENIKLEKLAFVDSLTGAINRRRFEELSKIEIARVMRYEHDLSILMLDIDHFKLVNDTHGHAAGDKVLVDFTNTCKEMLRDIDIVARIGGEEFVILLPETDRDGAVIFAERLRKTILDSSSIIDNNEIKYTVSIGIALYMEGDKTIDTILQRADEALYSAKNTGRNKVV